MAEVKINAWDVAQVLGLEYVKTDHVNYEYYHVYNFRDCVITIDENYYDVRNREEANLSAAQRVIDMVAIAASNWKKLV